MTAWGGASSKRLREKLDAMDRVVRAAEDVALNGRWALSAREDGTAQVYAPSYGALRKLTPIAETTEPAGRLMAVFGPSNARLVLHAVRSAADILDAKSVDDGVAARRVFEGAMYALAELLPKP